MEWLNRTLGERRTCYWEGIHWDMQLDTLPGYALLELFPGEEHMRDDQGRSVSPVSLPWTRR